MHTKSNKRFQTTTENASTFIDFLMPHPFTPTPASASSRTQRISVGPCSASHSRLILHLISKIRTPLIIFGPHALRVFQEYLVESSEYKDFLTND